MNRHTLREFKNTELLVSPSVLSSDFANLAAELRMLETAKADLVHLDVMDAHFVPNLTFGAPVIAAMRKHSVLPFDVHLMISHPLTYVPAFAKAGADHITFHIESEDDPQATIDAIHAEGCSAGLTLRPGTPASALAPYLKEVEMVLIMSVEPGFGGQKFMPDQLKKAAELRKMLDDCGNTAAHVEIDGGLDENNVQAAAESGVNIIVAGTSVFKYKDGPAAGIEVLHAARKFLK